MPLIEIEKTYVTQGFSILLGGGVSPRSRMLLTFEILLHRLRESNQRQLPQVDFF